MSFAFLGPDPVHEQVNAVLARLAAGEPPSRIEVAQVDVKEEPGRRSAAGAIVPGSSENEAAAQYLAGEMACFANTTGGGAIILGIADDGTGIGTELDAEWLRHRIWQLTDGKLTVTIREVLLSKVRLLVLTTHEAIEPIRYHGRVKWRVNDNCVEIDPTTWHTHKLQRIGYDWSAQSSGHTSADASPVALDISRRYLQSAAAAGDDAAQELAAASDNDLLRRLHLIDSDGHLTNAGSLLFVGTPDIGIDYIRRDFPGGDSTNRVRTNRPLLEQIYETEKASEAANRRVHVPDGFAHGQLRAIPVRALREAIINGLVHRDWLVPQPTTIEHLGDMATVTSPGGFIGGVDPSNIITHPAMPRYRSLAEAVASLRLSEREGIGVDRMVRDMLALGHHKPEITQTAGPRVRVSLIGGEPDKQTVTLFASMEPSATSGDVDIILLVTHVIQTGWVDVERARPILQRPQNEARAAIDRLARVRVNGSPVILPIRGVPSGEPDAYRLSDSAKEMVSGRVQHLESPNGRTALICGWATARGRVSTTEAADLTGLSVPYTGTLLTALEEEGLLLPGRKNKMGRGFYYVPADKTPYTAP